MVFDWLWWCFHLLGNKYCPMMGFLFIRFWENEGKIIDFNLEILDFIFINWEGIKLFGFVVIKFWYLPDMVLWLISCLDYSYYMIFLIWICFWWICWKIGFMHRVWLHKRMGGVCLSIASKGLAIIKIGDWRYWNHIPIEESRWDLFNFLTLFF